MSSFFTSTHDPSSPQLVLKICINQITSKPEKRWCQYKDSIRFFFYMANSLFFSCLTDIPIRSVSKTSSLDWTYMHVHWPWEPTSMCILSAQIYRIILTVVVPDCIKWSHTNFLRGLSIAGSIIAGTVNYLVASLGLAKIEVAELRTCIQTSPVLELFCESRIWGK